MRRDPLDLSKVCPRSGAGVHPCFAVFLGQFSRRRVCTFDSAGADRDFPASSAYPTFPSDEHRDLLLPRLKRLRQPGRESRGRAERARVRHDDRQGPSGQFDVWTTAARLLQARGAPVPGARRSTCALAGLTLARRAGCGGAASRTGSSSSAPTRCAPPTRSLTAPRPAAHVRASSPTSSRRCRSTRPHCTSSRRWSRRRATPQRWRWLAADRRVAKATRELGVAAQRRDFPSVTAAASRA